MDIQRGKHSFRGHNPQNSSHSRFEPNNFNIPNHGIFLTPTKIQKNSLKWKNRKQNSKFPYNKNDSNFKKMTKTAEDKEEEERKKKLSDTANKLLNKIKTWTAKTTEDSGDPQPSTPEVGESDPVSEAKTNSPEKPKRIAHAKKAKLDKNKTKKTKNKLSKAKVVYDVNKETVKNFQNRIQHKLIEEIMQMPKENLQNVLNDPKINPRMELKMSRLVRENKLLIAHKLREIAESKINTIDSFKSTQLLVDIDKLIDPVIETDLSVLPYELIKQMENIFQVQFDHSNPPQSEVDGVMLGEDISGQSVNVKVENNEDLSFYECSTDEDDNNDECSSEQLMENLPHIENESNEMEAPNDTTDADPTESVMETQTSSDPVEDTSQTHIQQTDTVDQSIQNTQCVSTQTDDSPNNLSSLLQPEPSTSNYLYGVPLPVETTNPNLLTLMTEMNAIQTLTNKLNERRLNIFLQLAQINPEGNFVCDDTIRRGFIETLSNGSLTLVDSLRQYLFNKKRNGTQKSEKKNNKNKQKNR